MQHAHHWAAQPEADIRIRQIELRIVHLRLNDGVHVRDLAANRGGNQAADDQASHGRIAIREMQRVRGFAETFFELQPESIEADGVVLGGFERGHGVDVLVVASALAQEKRNGVGHNFCDFEQKILVAHLRQLGFFFFEAHPGHVIGILAVQANQVGARGVCERCLC